jgi:isopentenyl diphosphate isomerase/L-lactate dehydrogenase-like FMN-dependent dehydrogenase
MMPQNSIHTVYRQFKQRVEAVLTDHKLRLHFKDNTEMNASLFNILSYGNAQYMRTNDTWSTSQRTADLRAYNSMPELFAKHDINEALFRRFHKSMSNLVVTLDLDWACEPAIEETLDFLNNQHITPTVFITHPSPRVEASMDLLEVGLHPYFGPNSSHGTSVTEVVKYIMDLPLISFSVS